MKEMEWQSIRIHRDVRRGMLLIERFDDAPDKSDDVMHVKSKTLFDEPTVGEASRYLEEWSR